MPRTDSLGEIIDKLITNGIKQYMQEEIRHNSSNDPQRLAASDKITILNKKRWQLIAAINELIDSEFKPEQKDY